MLWFLWITLVLIPVHPARSHKGSPGLLCTNDYYNTVSCSLTRPSLGFAKGCWISGVKTFWERGKELNTTRNCTVKQHRNSSLGCSFVFESKTFSSHEKMPVISLNCNGTQVENITNYVVQNYIKMHPPGGPQVNITANFTLMSWSLASPISMYFRSTFDFELQIKQREQNWKDARNFPTDKQELTFQVGELKGHLEARVRVKPHKRDKSNWSDWSPTTSWRVLADKKNYSSPPYWSPYDGLVRWILIALGLSFLLVVVLCKRNKIQGLLKGKPLPNPSEYFQAHHSVHRGSLKEWLNPHPGTQSFFVAPSCDQISHVVVCGDWNETAPSPSPTSGSTSPLLHFHKYPPSLSNNDRVLYNSSSQSNFSNVGYFMSSSSGGSARTDPNPAYFIYHDSFQNPSHILDPLFSMCDPLTSFPEYESLKREPESPDSGFGIMKEDEMDETRRDICREEQEGLTDRSSRLCFLQLHHPSCAPSAQSTHSSTLTQPCESQQADVSETDASRSSAAQLVASAMCRSSSMPVEPFKTGYLTLKELQMTFSNKSI